MALLHNPAPPWILPSSRYITLWHGCTSDDKSVIEKIGIDVGLGRGDGDFGRGFYTTTLERQARDWAWLRFYDPKFARKTAVQPVVLEFRVDRHELAKLLCLAFVMPGYDNEAYWSLVQHCRQSTPTLVHDHAGPVSDGQNNWYDVVYGPVSAFWEQRSAMVDSDQMSFHTTRAAALLTALIRTGDPGVYQWHVIT